MSDKSFFSKILCHWYESHQRDLPWRNTNDPYLIWISEIILQQTRVNQGYTYYIRFTDRFPDVKSLATADIDEVMKYWEGLGYYSRARNLHEAAKQIHSSGQFPSDYDAIRKLKGVGEYTAAAIASFAFGLNYAVVDGNVYRVLSRYFGIDTPIDTTEGKKYFHSLANDLLPQIQSVATYNQAIMDFGAVQCVPKSPDCITCPLCDSCFAHNQSAIDNYPVKTKKLQIKNRYLNYFIIRVDNEIWLRRREDKDIWQGLYEPFLIETNNESDLIKIVEQEMLSSIKFSSRKEQKVIAMNIHHQLTHRTLICNFVEIVSEIKPSIEFQRKGRWFDVDEIGDLAFPKVIEKVMSLYLTNKGKKKKT